MSRFHLLMPQQLLSVTVDEDAMLPEGGFAGQVMATMKEACRQVTLRNLPTVMR